MRLEIGLESDMVAKWLKVCVAGDKTAVVVVASYPVRFKALVCDNQGERSREGASPVYHVSTRWHAQTHSERPSFKGLAKQQRTVLPNIYLFLPQWSKRLCLNHFSWLLDNVEWCWMSNIQFVTQTSRNLFVIFFNKCCIKRCVTVLPGPNWDERRRCAELSLRSVWT